MSWSWWILNLMLIGQDGSLFFTPVYVAVSGDLSNCTMLYSTRKVCGIDYHTLPELAFVLSFSLVQAPYRWNSLGDGRTLDCQRYPSWVPPWKTLVVCHMVATCGMWCRRCPGPNYKHPFGVCGKPVKNNQAGIHAVRGVLLRPFYQKFTPTMYT